MFFVKFIYKLHIYLILYKCRVAITSMFSNRFWTSVFFLAWFPHLLTALYMPCHINPSHLHLNLQVKTG